MLLVCAITVMNLVSYLKERDFVLKHAILAVYLSCLFLAMFTLEYSMGHIEFFNSDELLYLTQATEGIPPVGDRYLWYVVNYWVTQHDLYMAGYSLKLINIPIIAAYLLALWKTFDHDRRVFLIALLLPYTLYVGTMNLRDPAIMLLSVVALRELSEDVGQRKAVKGCLALLGVYLLRGFAAMEIAVLVILSVLYRNKLDIKAARYRRLLRRTVPLLLLLAVLGILFFDTLQMTFSRYLSWFLYTTGAGEYEHVMQVSGGYTTGTRWIDFLISSIRYIFTPMPLSLLPRLFSGGSDMWGFTDDLIRILHQIGYYAILAYLVMNLRYVTTGLRQMSVSQTLVFLYGLSYWPIYSFHLYGATHQRLKLPFQIALYLLALQVSDAKQSVGTRLEVVLTRFDGHTDKTYTLDGGCVHGKSAKETVYQRVQRTGR